MSEYERRLDELVDWARSNPGTAGARTIRKVVFDLEADGPVGEMLFSVDEELFLKIIELLVEFRRSGRGQSFNSIHRAARDRLMNQKRVAVADSGNQDG